MKRINFFKIFFYIFILFWIFISVNWGLMNDSQKSLIECGILNKSKLYSDLEKARNDLYRDGKDYYFHNIASQISTNIIDYRNNTGLSNFYTAIRPYYLRTTHSDEQATLFALSNMNPYKFEFDPHFYQYGGSYIYPLGFYLKVLDTLKIINLVPDIKYYFNNIQEMANIYISCRVYIGLSVFVLTLILYKLLRRFCSDNFSVLLTLLFVTLPVITLFKSIIKAHIVAPAFGIVSLYYLYKIIVNGEIRYRNFILCGLWTGLAAGSIILYFSYLIIPLTAIIYYKKINIRNKIFYIIIICFTALIFYVVSNPYFILNINKNIHHYDTFRKVYHSYENGLLVHFIYGLPKFFSKCFEGLGPALFLFIFMLCQLGLYFKKISNDNKRISYIIGIFIFLISYSLYFELPITKIFKREHIRIYIPAIPIIILFIGLMYHYISNFNKKVVQILLLSGIMYNLIISGQYQFEFFQGSINNRTSLQAGAWINLNIPEDRTIGLHYIPQPHYCPPFGFSKYKLIVPFSADTQVDYVIIKNIDRDRDILHRLLNSKDYKLIKVFKNKRLFEIVNHLVSSDIYIFQKI
ncbi:MAG: hypothetical protein AB1765_01530 [Candidatus Hydrogenedentota bacterium]